MIKILLALVILTLLLLFAYQTKHIWFNLTTLQKVLGVVICLGLAASILTIIATLF